MGGREYEGGWFPDTARHPSSLRCPARRDSRRQASQPLGKGSGFDNIQHALLNCEHEEMIRIWSVLRQKLTDSLEPRQAAEFDKYAQHDKKMMLLGKQMNSGLDIDQRKSVDLAVKVALESIDDFRNSALG